MPVLAVDAIERLLQGGAGWGDFRGLAEDTEGHEAAIEWALGRLETASAGDVRRELRSGGSPLEEANAQHWVQLDDRQRAGIHWFCGRDGEESMLLLAEQFPDPQVLMELVGSGILERRGDRLSLKPSFRRWVARMAQVPERLAS